MPKQRRSHLTVSVLALVAGTSCVAGQGNPTSLLETFDPNTDEANWASIESTWVDDIDLVPGGHSSGNAILFSDKGYGFDTRVFDLLEPAGFLWPRPKDRETIH